jgi:predicted DNA-binding transcriptional regulator YafY
MADTKLAERLAEIIGMLNNGNEINYFDLASYFNVSERTIRRDINERLSFLSIDKNGNSFKLNKLQTNSLNKDLINVFAQRCGITELFPFFDTAFINTLMEPKESSAYLIKPSNFETHEVNVSRNTFIKIEQAITSNKQISFTYNSKKYTDIQPYKIINFDGFWYLAASDNGKLKSFHIGLINSLWNNGTLFVKEDYIQQQILSDDSIWFGQPKTKVSLKVDNAIAHFFNRREFFPEQKIVEITKEGDLIITTKIANKKQILPLIKKWIPNIHIITPNSLKKKLQEELIAYIK